MSDPLDQGDEITEFVAQLPSTKLEASEAYPRGTLLTLNVQVRVRNVYTDEDRKGNLFVRHNLVIEDCTVTDVLTPAQRRALIEAAEAEVERKAAELFDGESTQYTVSEEPSMEDTHDDEPENVVVNEVSPSVATISVSVVERTIDDAPTASRVTDIRGRDFILDQQRAFSTVVDDLEDNDPDHAWMDEDDEGGLHLDTASLQAVVGF